LGKIEVTPDTIVDKVQAYPKPTLVKTAQVLNIIVTVLVTPWGVGRWLDRACN
jgi:hypothetical protein